MRKQLERLKTLVPEIHAGMTVDETYEALGNYIEKQNERIESLSSNSQVDVRAYIGNLDFSEESN